MAGRWGRLLARTLATLSIVLVLAPAAVAQVYQWTDRDGVDHYTTDPDRIPAEHRAGVRVIDTPTPTGESAPLPGTILSAGRGPIVAEAHLNGVPLTLVVDTGAARLDVASAQVGPLAVIAHDVPGLPAHGLLGRDVLDHFVLTVDAARGRATLHR